MFCAVVRGGVRCCACALLGLRVARAPCPGVLLRRRGDTPSLWRARLAPWRALLAPGCGPVRGSGLCAQGRSSAGGRNIQGGPTQGPSEAHAELEARTTTPDTPKHTTNRGPSPGGHTRDEDSFDAFMESCRSASHTDATPTARRSHPEPGADQTGGRPLTVSHQAHMQRDKAGQGARTGDTAATVDGHATAREAAGQTPDEPPRHSAQGSGTRVETCTNTASEPADQPPRTTPSLEQGHLDYARSDGNARHPSPHTEQVAGQDLDLWIDRFATGERLALAVSIRWLPTSHSGHLEEGTRTMADTAFGHRAGPHALSTTMDYPSQWHYVATRLKAHMGTYSSDEMNELQWRWHRRAGLHIRRAMQRHNIWAIPGSPGYQGHASEHQRPRSQEVPEPPRQTARQDSPGQHQGPQPGTYRSPLQPFAPRRERGSPHTPVMQGRTPERLQETRNPDQSWRRSRKPPPAARRVVFHDGTYRGHGGPNDRSVQQTSSASNPRRWSRRLRTEQTHIATIPTPAERARQAALNTAPHQAKLVRTARLPPLSRGWWPVRDRG